MSMTAITFHIAQNQSHLFVTSLSYLIAAGMAFLGSIANRARGAADFVFSFFFFFFLAVPSYVQIGAGVFPWGAHLSPRDQLVAYGVIAAAHASYLIGGSSVEYFIKPQYSKIIRTDLEAVRFFSLWAFGFIMVAVILAVIAGPDLVFSARFESDPSASSDGASIQFLMMARSLSLLAYVMMIYLARRSPSLSGRRTNLYAALLVTPIFLVINYPPSLPRFMLFGNLIAVSLAFIDFKRPLVKAGSAIGGGILLFTIFPVIKMLGTRAASLSGILSAAEKVHALNYLLRVDFDAYMQIVSTVTYLGNGGGFRYGSNFLGVFLFFIPRAVWPGKPIDSGDIVSNALHYQYTNVSNPLPSEALIAFGAVGPILVFFLLGHILARIDFLTAKRALFQVQALHFFIYAIWAGFLVIILRGALNGVAPMFGTGFLAFFIMRMFFRRRVVWRGPS